CGRVNDFYGNPSYNYKVLFSWGELQQASTYRLRVEDIGATQGAPEPDGQGHTVVVLERTLSSNDFNANNGCPPTQEWLIPFTAGRQYRWNVTTDNTPYDSANAKTFITGLPYPNLVAPQNGKQVMLVDKCGANNSSLCQHFSWNGGKIAAANGGAPIEIPGVIGASSYDVEILKNGLPFICDSPGYTYVTPPPNPPFANTRNSFCDLSTPSVDNGDIFTWRVRARDASGATTQSGTGIPGPWSPYYTFTVLIPPVTLASPPDSNLVCDPYNDPGTIITNCSIVDCLDMAYYWSPIPNGFGTSGGGAKSCYRIEVSDTSDFRNLIFTDSTKAPVNTFPCPLQQCYQAGLDEGKYIPMTNGVVYYWRVGASVTPSQGGDCGLTWVYSNAWEYYKRPPAARNVTVTSTQDTATINWDHPSDCTSSTGQAKSFPAVPPAAGSYVIYLESATPTPTSPPTHIITRLQASSTNVQIGSLTPDTDYYICISAVDASNFEGHPGHVSNYNCVFTHTQAAENNQ
ncbi:MAG TPA: fibronectin type III domain-containing protein, partial [bacterium]|nr:fibronectin type III domain-containing protein [bacterium]